MVTYSDAVLRRWCKVASQHRQVPGRSLRPQDLAKIEGESGIPLDVLVEFATKNGWCER